MKKTLIILMLFIVGCSSEKYTVLYNLDPDKCFRVPPNAQVEWFDMRLKDPNVPKGQTISSRDVQIVDGEILGDIRVTKNWGWFISDDTMDNIMKAKIEEDLSPNIWERLWKWVGL